MTPNPSESDLAAADLANCIECLTHAAEFQCPEYRHIIDTVLAALASAQRDGKRLDWLLEYITQHGSRGVRKLPWTAMDDDGNSLMHREKVSEDEVADAKFDRTSLDAAMSKEPPL